MAPTRPPKLRQNPIFDTPWEGYILRCWWIFDANMEPKLLPNCAKFRYESQKVIFYLEQQSLMDFDDFKSILPPKREPKINKKWFQNGNRFRRPLESGFYEMLMNFGSQNGIQNLLKRYLKTGPKRDTQRMPSWRPKNPRDPLSPGAVADTQGPLLRIP